MRHARTIARGVSVLLAVGALTWLWSGTDGGHVAEHGRYESALRDLRRADRTLNQDVLRARVQLLNTYDPLVATRGRIEAAQRELTVTPAFLLEGERAPFVGVVDDYAGTIDRKQQLVESFKSRNSVLKNSLRYLPTIATEVAETADRVDARSTLGTEVRALLAHVLIYNLTSDESLAASIAVEADHIGSQRGRLPAAAAHDLDLLLVHVRTIVRAKPEVDALVADILSSPVVAGEEAVARTFLASYERAEERAERFQAALYAACMALAGLVAFAFHRLRRALRALREGNRTLERKVRERTASLDTRNDAMRLVLDNVEQGLVTADRTGRLCEERSPAVDRWMPGADQRPFLWDRLAAIDPRAAAWVCLGWEDLFLDELPFEVVVDQLPKRLSDGSRHFGLELRPIRDGERIDGILVVLTDVTDRVERERAEGESRDLLAAIGGILADRTAFLAFLAEADAIVARLHPGAPRARVRRDVHTLKGNAGLFGLDALVAACHALETRLEEGETDLVAGDLPQVWQTFVGRLQPLLGGPEDGRVELSAADYDALVASVADGHARPAILRAMERLRHEPAERRLAHFAQQALGQAARQGKPALEVRVESGDVRLDRERFAGFWSSFVHVLRNAVDHGVEDSREERLACGKDATAIIHLRALEDDDGVVIEVQDDGRGIRWDRVGARASRMGLPVATHEDLVAALFTDGLSTKDVVTEVSGRGVGAGVVLHAAQALGGSLEIQSEAGRGTTLRFRIPHPPRAIAAR